MQQMVVVLAAAALWLAGTSPVEAKPIHPVPYEPMPASVDELPVGEPTTLPWWQDGVLHVGENTIDTRFRRIAHRRDTTVVGRGTGIQGYPDSEWHLVVGDKLKRLVKGTVRMPRISANGRWIAWLEAKAVGVTNEGQEDEFVDTVYKLRVYNVAQRKVVDTYHNRRMVDRGDAINGIWLWGLDNRGRVFLQLGEEEEHLWRPGWPKPVKVSGHSYSEQYMDSWPRGIIRYGIQQSVGVYGKVNRQGHFAKVGRIRMPLSGTWSRAGDAFFFRDYDADTFWVDRVEDGLSIQLGVPESEEISFSDVGWESDTEVLLWHHDAHGDDATTVLLRCDALIGDCERVAGGPLPDSVATMQE